MSPATILRDLATLNEAKTKEYGSAPDRFGAIMKAFWPNGVGLLTEEDFNRYHLIMQMVVKLTRYMENIKNGHDDSLRDLAVYAAMLLAFDQAHPRIKNGHVAKYPSDT